MSNERSIDVSVPFEEAVSRTRAALQDQGFGVLSEIDLQGDCAGPLRRGSLVSA